MVRLERRESEDADGGYGSRHHRIIRAEADSARAEARTKTIGAQKAVAAAEKPAKAPEPAKPSGPSAVVQSHIDAINAAKLPDSNTNAASANAKLAATAEGGVRAQLDAVVSDFTDRLLGVKY